jgi:hypothetical protein
MTAPQQPTLAAKLLDMRPDIFAYIGKRLVPPVTRQVVARTARNPRISKRVYAALKFYARHRRMP